MPALTTKDVLIVDDDETVRLLLASALARLNATCDTAGDGSAAIGRAGTTRYDVLMVDLQTQQLDGRNLIRILRQRENRSADRPIVLLMTAADVPRHFDDLGDDVHAVIHKPFDITDVAELVLDCVKEHRLSSARRTKTADALRGESRPHGR